LVITTRIDGGFRPFFGAAKEKKAVSHQMVSPQHRNLFADYIFTIYIYIDIHIDIDIYIEIDIDIEIEIDIDTYVQINLG
jgi:hypothetical protein